MGLITLENIIYLLIFLQLSVNPAMGLRYLFMFDFKLDENIRFVKKLQVFNGIVSVLLFILITILFNRLAEGCEINW